MAQKPGTPQRGDPGRQNSRGALQEEPLRSGGERKRLEEERVRRTGIESDAVGGSQSHRCARASAPLRCAPREERLTGKTLAEMLRPS